MIRIRHLVTLSVAAAAVLVVGCGKEIPSPGEEVQVSGKVPAPAGKSLTGFNIYFQPTGGKARAAQFPIQSDGGFAGTMTAGTYTYYLMPGKPPATEKALEAFPEAYRQGSLDRQVEVKAGTIELKF